MSHNQELRPLVMADDTRSYITFALISCNVESSSGGFAWVLSYKKDTFEEYEYRMHRSTISSIVLRFEDVFYLPGHWKNRSTILQHLRWKGASELDLELMRHRTTILGIVVRFVRDLIFSYKSQTNFWGKGSKF